LLYQLPNGRVIEISTEQYLEMTDEELEYLIAFNYGDAIDNPWFGSVISKKAPKEEEIEDDIITPIHEVSDEIKLEDLDIDIEQ
jgi:hypothetical protein